MSQHKKAAGKKRVFMIATISDMAVYSKDA
jgi:hypothetical protein